ncbi:MAG TPA: response regulator transcription factor [Candidatus Kapabacteria bacterium]|nr:response regulator transcription factor [Candidatus Kapabacteria bacterium]
MTKTILIVDDEHSIREFLKFLLESRGYNILLAHTAAEALEEARKKPSLILLDVMMPGIDGWQIAKMLKDHPDTNAIPIIFVTASQSVADEVTSFEVGAVDYITKPFNIPKLLARINSVLHRTSESAAIPKTVAVNEVMLDVENYAIAIDGQITQLPKKEFEIFLYMARNPNKLVSREELLGNVWGNDTYVTERTIDVHIRQIRKKLGKYSDYIETIKGVGYRVKTADAGPTNLKLVALP